MVVRQRFIIRPILGKNLTKYSGSCSERCDFSGPRLYIESKRDLTRILGHDSHSVHSQCPGLLDAINVSFVYILPSGMTCGLVHRRVIGNPSRVNKEVSPSDSFPDR